jgi:hypothetical protein
MLDKTRIRRFHAALAGSGQQAHKSAILGAYGVDSTKDLTPEQADDAIQKLNELSTAQKTDAPKPIRRARSVALTLINALGIYATNNDWTKVNEFLLNPRIAGKLLYQMDLEELKALNRKLRAMIKKRNEQLDKENYQAANN